MKYVCSRTSISTSNEVTDTVTGKEKHDERTYSPAMARTDQLKKSKRQKEEKIENNNIAQLFRMFYAWNTTKLMITGGAHNMYGREYVGHARV